MMEGLPNTAVEEEGWMPVGRWMQFAARFGPAWRPTVVGNMLTLAQD